MAPLTDEEMTANEAAAINSGQSTGCLEDLDIDQSAADTLAAFDALDQKQK